MDEGSNCISVLSHLAVEGMVVSSCDCFLLCLENGWMKLSVVIYTPVIPAFRLLRQEDLKIKAGLRYTVEQTLSGGGR